MKNSYNFQYFCSAHKETWIYSATHNWTHCPDMIQARYYHAYSSFLLNGNQILAVSPGFDGGKTVELLKLQQENH